MNNARRKLIEDIMARLEPLKDEIDSVMNDEQEAFDNMPEGLQQSARGEAAESAISSLDSASSSIDDAMGELSSAMEAKMTYHGHVERVVRGETFVFHVYRDSRMQHVYGNGDKDSTGKPALGDDGAVITQSQTSALLARGRVKPGWFDRPHA